ncbi:MAG: TonB-dependent receptor [Bacteroidota bacterium]
MIRPTFRIFLILFFISNFLIAQRNDDGVIRGEEGPFELKGRVYSLETGEPIIGANVFIERYNKGTSTNGDGEYMFSIYSGAYTIRVSNVGYITVTKTLNIFGPRSLNFGLKTSVTELDELVFRSEKENQNVSSKSVGTSVLDLESIKTIPRLGGEVDVLKSLTLLPGVSTQGEASSGFSVRGGGTDQNLILLGGATLYNPSHLFGFFSSFNASIVQSVALYKGVVPAQYGGRASSVVDVTYKRGNFRNWEGNVSLGIVASRFSAGGPVIKDRLSIMTAGRFAYPTWLLTNSNDPNIANSNAQFFDGNFIANYIINERNDLEYSFYRSGDEFNFSNGTANEWSNLAQVIKWNSVLKDNLTLKVALIQSRYQSSLIDNSQVNGFQVESQINHLQSNAELEWALSPKSTIKGGAQFTRLKNDVGDLRPIGSSIVEPIFLDPETGHEIGFFLQHDIDLTDKFGLNYGLRYSIFSDRGPATINTYESGRTRSPISVTGTTEFDAGSIQTYDGLEPRLQLRYRITPTLSTKGGASQSYQYIHLITNTSSSLPTDIWKLSDPFLEPQIVRQYSIGLFKNYRNNMWETSIEGYYKELDNLVDFKEGADLFVNPELETELISATGESYGVEFYIKKSRGRFNGWFSYAYARSWRTADNEFDEETLNGGERFPANLDSPHNINLVGNYRLGGNTQFSFVFTYNSGRPVTLPLGKFEYDREDLPFFQDRNNERAPSNHRLDISLQFKIPSKHKLLDGDWTLGLYNVYGRDNPFSVFFQDLPGFPPQAYKLSIIGSAFPTLSYEVSF